MEWCRRSIDILIEAYSKEECLYDNKSRFYHNKRARQRALENVCEALKDIRPCESSDIVNKMKSLRTTFVAELNKIINSKARGVGMDDVYTPSLWYFEKLMFLIDHVQSRKSISYADIPRKDGTSVRTLNEVSGGHLFCKLYKH